MTQVVDLDELVPDDIEFKYRGKTYVLPGDPPNDDVLALVKHYGRMIEDLRDENDEAEGKPRPERTDEEVEAQVEAAIEAMKQVLLGLFRIADPEIQEWPFGMYSTQHVSRTVLLRLGLLRLADPTDEAVKEQEPPPTRPTRNRRKQGSSAS